MTEGFTAKRGLHELFLMIFFLLKWFELFYEDIRKMLYFRIFKQVSCQIFEKKSFLICPTSLNVRQILKKVSLYVRRLEMPTYFFPTCSYMSARTTFIYHFISVCS
jgi:hypothetical protein